MDVDPVMIVLGTRRYARFVASANLLKGFLGALLKFFFAPIPREKGASADKTVRDIEENLRNGVSVAMFPEGNKSWDGETAFISKRTATLVKDAGVALVTYRFVGNYMRNPRWAKHKRHGRIYGAAVNEYSAEQVANMSADELYAVICNDLKVNAYEVQRENPQPYKGKKLAEGLELAAYLCPVCKKFDVIKTSGDEITCTCCGMSATLDDVGFFHSDNLPFDNLCDWSHWQKKYISENAETIKNMKGIISKDEDVSFRINGETIDEKAKVRIFGDRISVLTKNKIYDYLFKDIQKVGAFRTTRVYLTSKDDYLEFYKPDGISGTKIFTLWRAFIGKKVY